MAERTEKSDFYAAYTPPETPTRELTDGPVVRKKVGKTARSPLATLLTDVTDVVENSPFQFVAPARPCPGGADVNNAAAQGHLTGRAVRDDVTALPAHGGKMFGQPSTIPELEKDITAKIEDHFMQRINLAMEQAFGNFLNNSRGSLMSMRGGELEDCVISPHESESYASANQAKTNNANVGTSHAGTETARARDETATAANVCDANIKEGLSKCSSPTIAPVAFPAAVNQPGDLIPALTTAFATALTNVQITAPAPAPRGGHLNVGHYDGLTSWETYWAQFCLLATANGWSPAERAVQLISALEGEARKVLLDVTAADLENPQAISRALERRFGNTTPAVVMRQRFNERVRAPGEKLGVFAAELRFLAQKGFPDFDDATRMVLTKEAFIHGLLPPPLRQQVRLADPQTLEAALEKALAVEDILMEGFEPHSGPGSTHHKTQAPQPPGPAPVLAGPGRPLMSPEDRSRQICWRCNQGGHSRRFCPVPDSALGVPASENARGSV